jgi:hypothetical protein
VPIIECSKVPFTKNAHVAVTPRNQFSKVNAQPATFTTLMVCVLLVSIRVVLVGVKLVVTVLCVFVVDI